VNIEPFFCPAIVTADMTAANSEEGRKCYMMVRYGGVTRRIEWHTSWKSFEKLETKVRSIFHIDSKSKLTFKYLTCKGPSVEHITMSSDEELGVALELLVGDEMVLEVEANSRKKRGTLARVMRAGKAVKPKALALCAAVGAYLPRPVVTGLRALPRPSVGARALLHNTMRTIVNFNYRRLVLPLAILGLAMCIHFAPKVIGTTRLSRGDHFTIVAATYGGMDVTTTVQKYYAQHKVVLASNNLYGDPMVGTRKHLHVVYQHTTGHTTTTFTESISEFGQPSALSMKYEDCLYSSEVIVDGHNVRVLGALYDGHQVTCAVKKMAYTGRISEWPRSGGEVSSRNFQVPKEGHGVFTMVYLKDNKLKTFQGVEGSPIKF
jgi:hypothetical protein